MPRPCASQLHQRLLASLEDVRIIDCHEHLQRDSELPTGDAVTIGRFFAHYANCDLISAGMPVGDMAKVIDPTSGLSPRERWALLKPWYGRAWNTAYCESLRIAMRDLYGVDDFADDTVEPLTQAMRKRVRAGFTREVFDEAGIDIAMNNVFGPKLIYNADLAPDCFLPDMTDAFTGFPIAELCAQSGRDILSLDDYLATIDAYFDQYASAAGAFKVGRAYDRPLRFEDLPRHDVEKTFLRLLAFNDRPDRRDLQALEDYVLHYLCRLCGEHGLRMKFHTGLQEGNANVITNSRAALMANLFMKYPKTGFDIYHISYPYEEELATLAKNFPNVTVDFCWMWIINPAAGRRALSDMLDTVPANKIHGFGGDYIFAEGSYGHVKIARREIARVLAEKVEEGRFSEDYAVQVGRMLLRNNPLANFDIEKRKAVYAGKAATRQEP